jgi:hypothetical protein
MRLSHITGYGKRLYQGSLTLLTIRDTLSLWSAHAEDYMHFWGKLKNLFL